MSDESTPGEELTDAPASDEDVNNGVHDDAHDGTDDEVESISPGKSVLYSTLFNAAVLLSFFIIWLCLSWAIYFLLERSYLPGILILALAFSVIAGTVVLYRTHSKRMGKGYGETGVLDLLKMKEGTVKKILRVGWKALRFVLLIYLGIYIGVSCIFYVHQERFLYHPRTEITSTPDDFALTYEDIFFSTSDGIELNGWYVGSPGSNITVLFFHGNAGNMGVRTELMRVLYDMGLNVFTFDYRGFGKSEGEPTEEGTYLDAEAALDYLVTEKNCTMDRIIIYGWSLGGAISSHLAAEHTPAAFILEGSFTSYDDIAGDIFHRMLLPAPLGLLADFEYETSDNVARVECPVLVIHSKDDKVVPYHHGKELYEAAGEPKEFLELRGTHDNAYLESDEYVGVVWDFVERHT